jgi:Ca2+-binding RTX toxin-like protein
MTRKIAVLFAVMGLMVMAFAGVALTVTKVGDAGPNRLVGTAENDTLRGRGGADKLIGRGDSDQLFGGRTFDDNPDADDRGFNDRGLQLAPIGHGWREGRPSQR